MSQDNPLKVLILEDRPSDAELILYELKRAGYHYTSTRVDTRESYVEAIRNGVDIILADYNLPQFNAKQAIHLLQESNLDIPLIVITGSISEEVAVETMKEGAADYLLKDRLSRLGQAVQRALTEKKLRDEKRLADQALRISEDKFSKAFHISPDAIAILELEDGRYIEINDGFTRLTGFLPEDVIGKNNLAFTIFANLDENTRFQDAIRGKQEVHNMEAVFKKKDGTLWIGLVSARIIEVENRPSVIAIIRDITERKRSELELQRAHTDLAEAYDATIEGWSRVLDLRDKETEGHTQRVAEMTIRLARALGVPDEELIHIRRGALLHDIGKMAIPNQILEKPGPLTEEEWQLMRKHPEYAFQMLHPIVYLRPSLDIPYCHHERWDGSGYPRQLKGEEIPLAARIFSIVDVWDALRSDRPYRQGCSEESVLDYIRENKGIQFDPKLVDAFLELHKRNAFTDAQLPSQPRGLNIVPDNHK